MSRQIIENIFRYNRIQDSLETKGIAIRGRAKATYSNMKFDGYGRLQDGRVSYAQRYEISGNTFSVKEVIKSAGFKWDAGDKVWHSAEYNDTIGAKILRFLAK